MSHSISISFGDFCIFLTIENSLPNIYSLSLPTILKNRSGNSSISKPPSLPTPSTLPNFNLPIFIQPPISPKTGIFNLPKITPINTNYTHPFLPWLQLKITGLKASKTQQLIVAVLLILSISVSAAWQSSQVKKQIHDFIKIKQQLKITTQKTPLFNTIS